MRTLPILIAAFALACEGGIDVGDGPAAPAQIAPDEMPDEPVDPPKRPDPEPDGPAPFDTRPGVERLAVWNATPGETLRVVGPTLQKAVADELGSYVFRELEPGRYTVKGEGGRQVEALHVVSVEASKPGQGFYDGQTLEPGFGYLTTRDGTQLSIFVSLPGPPEDGPYPTLVNYSGYSPSQPGQPLGGPADALCNSYPILCNAPSFPTGIIGGVMGFATVGINVRGTGCSGGAYDFFDTAQLLDGYDAIEIVAAQKWVKGHKVGMVGLSYPGITQLFLAAQQPPSLAAIAPMSVLADTASSTLVPGGIYNNGFALAWIENVLERARPYGHRWIEEVAETDALCEENQLLHGQKVDAVAKALDNPYYNDEVAKPLDPTAFADRITVPVFMTGQWQDEQTGPHFAALADKFDNAPVFRMTATNGVHVDGLAPQVLVDWAAFLSLYVADEVPGIDPVLRTLVPVFMESVFGTSLDLPPDRFTDMDYETARAAYEAEKPIRIIFESGAALATEAGAPQGAFEHFFDAWPLPETQPTRWFLAPDGKLAETPADEDGGASTWLHEPEAGQRSMLSGGGINGLQPNWIYAPPEADRALSFITEPLAQRQVMIGSASVDLWLRSDRRDADIEVNLSEVREDGMESYVQSGWLRASHRVLRHDATELRPVKSHREEDVEPLVPGEWTLVRVEVMPFAHVFRAGSRVRLTIDSPGDSRADWLFLSLEQEAQNDVAHSAAYPSSMVLPVVPNLNATPQTECNRLRGQPCREYTPFENAPAE